MEPGEAEAGVWGGLRVLLEQLGRQSLSACLRRPRPCCRPGTAKAHSGNPLNPSNPKPSGLILTPDPRGFLQTGASCALSLPVYVHGPSSQELEETFPNIEVACEFPCPGEVTSTRRKQSGSGLA